VISIPQESQSTLKNQVWSQVSSIPVSEELSSFVPLSPVLQYSSISVNIQIWIILALSLSLARCFWQLSRNGIKIFKLIQSSFLLKKIGSVRILISDQITIPFSFYFPRKSYVLIPQDFLEHQDELKLVILHEIQHHRQGDTRWVYFIQILKSVFFFNPFVYLWNTQISIIQEFACDEALVALKGISPLAYGSCLAKAAQTALSTRFWFVGTANMATSATGKTLKRRIEMMFLYPHKKGNKIPNILLGTLAMVTLVTTALASQGLVSHGRMTLAEVQDLVNKTKWSREFPIVANEQVTAALNDYLSTSEKRGDVRKILERMKEDRALIENKIQEYGLPKELLAIPFAESGFQNLKRGSLGSGIWMFIPEAARNFQLVVNAKRDDRLDKGLETDAAMRYLKSNYLRFRDWGLAILAYNSGEARIQKGIEKTESRDVWKLIGEGYQNDKNYLATVLAAALIIENPNLAK
jgi:membrane-bound lytic murein transglycosylase D